MKKTFYIFDGFSSGGLSQFFIKKTLVNTIALCALGALDVHSAPTGGVVLSGAGNIQNSNNLTRIHQDSQYLSVQWDTFDVQRNERVSFVQPDAKAIALNRILDPNGSQILGRVDANGHVVLVNPNGIFFGRNATVNVGSLVASGLNIDDRSFEDVRVLTMYRDENGRGSVVNEGLINVPSGGQVLLFGKTVANDGFINAPQGRISLISATEMIMWFDNEQLWGVGVAADEFQDEVGVLNSGVIQASGGEVFLHSAQSGDALAAAVYRGNLSDKNTLKLNPDGSFDFNMNASNAVVNSGSIDVSAYDPAVQEAGFVLVVGKSVEHSGSISANAYGGKEAGQIMMQADDDVLLSGQIEAESDVYSGLVRVRSSRLISDSSATILSGGETRIFIGQWAELPDITTHHLGLRSLGHVTQQTPLVIPGLTELEANSMGSINLQHEHNDFNRVTSIGGFSSNTYIKDMNDIELGATRLNDATLKIEALGENSLIRQIDGTHIRQTDSSLYLTADNVILGENGGTLFSFGGTFDVHFTQQIALNGAIEILDAEYDAYSTWSRIRGYYPNNENNELFLTVDSKSAIDVNASYDGQHNLLIERIVGAGATLGGSQLNVTQSGAIQLSDQLVWNGYQGVLENPNNDVQSIAAYMPVPHSSLSYVDKNDLEMGHLFSPFSADFKIVSVGEGATLRQQNSSDISASNLYFSADYIEMGAHNFANVYAEKSLTFRVGRNLLIDGGWNVSLAPASFLIEGSDADNRVEFGVHAGNIYERNFNQFHIDLKGGDDTLIFNAPIKIADSDRANASINLGAGKDKIYLQYDVNVPIYLEEGRDSVYVWNPSVTHYLEDIDYLQDRLIYGAWY